MNKMCHVCGSDQKNLGSGRCNICRIPFCQECEKRDNPSTVDGEYLGLCCRSCLEKFAKESLGVYGLSDYTTPQISPSLSLSSYESCTSSCGDFQADVSSKSREDVDEILDTGKSYPSRGISGDPFEEHDKRVLRNVEIGSSYVKNVLDRSKHLVVMEEMDNSGALSNHEDNNGDKIDLHASTYEDSLSARAMDDSDGAEMASEIRTPLFLCNIETDPLIWNPPDPEDMDGDIDSVANIADDDDDDYIDGTKWGKPASLGSLDEELQSRQYYKEERQKAMMEAMNGQFKILVSRFLASEGIPYSDGEGGESWLDIVASLSWEAALLIKPDANEGRAMDPASYVKVKCIASGFRSHSQVVNGLVFKKNAAHKHMPTMHRNPKLLLFRGVLGHPAAGLSSFDSMEQEKDSLKSMTDVIGICQANVVLVEKTASRDIQESLLAKGITLAFDMKLTRLERIARCTGSEIFPFADVLMKPKLKQCEYFHIEKFLEEHNSSNESGRKSNKTLMFLEGFSKPLGCTILLKGAHIDELKKVKRVIHYTVFAAYHLILETSYFLDQRAFFSDIHVAEGYNSLPDHLVNPHICGPIPSPTTFSLEGSKAFISSVVYDVPISNGLSENSSSEMKDHIPELDAKNSLLPVLGSAGNKINSLFSTHDSDEILQSADPGKLLSSVSASFRRFWGDSFPPITSDSISSYFGFKEKEPSDHFVDILPVIQSPQTLDPELKANGKMDSLEIDGVDIAKKSGSASDSGGPIGGCTSVIDNNVQVQNKDDIDSVLDPQTILVLLSSHCIAKRTVCEQSHLSRIKYYGNFDVSLGRFLQDILLNQKHCCLSCGEPPEGHIYRYTHQNGNITVLVRKLPSELSLSGEAEGKIWMWTRCLKCEREHGILRSTQRVVMSTAARGLSFGKFLELSFSSHSAANRLSKCGHSLHRDCLRFFGLGSKVAMFRYSSVEIYAACKPPPIVEFYSPKQQEWLQKEAKNMLLKSEIFFSEVGNLLQKLKPGLSSSSLMQSIGRSSAKEFCEIEEMLIHEKAEFEDPLVKAVNHDGQTGKNVHEIVDVNWLNQELLFELYVWDCRLHSLMNTRDNETGHELFHEEMDVTPCNDSVERNTTENDSKILEYPIEIPIVSFSSSNPQCSQNTEVGMETTSVEFLGDANITTSKSSGVGNALVKSLPVGSTSELVSTVDQDPENKPALHSHASNKVYQDGYILISENMQVDLSSPVTDEPLRYVENTRESGLRSVEAENNGGISAKDTLKALLPDLSHKPPYSKTEDPDGWIWSSFSELRRAYRKDLQGGYPQKFAFIHRYCPIHLSPFNKLTSHDMDSLHFPVGSGGNVISVCEDEISSIISCALALSEGQYGLFENKENVEALDGKLEVDKLVESYYGLRSDAAVVSSYWSSTGSLDSEGTRSTLSVSSLSSDELSTSGSDALLPVDRNLASDNLHPEIPVGFGRVAGKSKFSVVCIHAKQFYDLRKKCCLSELAYISSLGHCKKWDAQGGKSKAFFAKTMDERLIIKQIKKTELDSFLKFAPNYFKHITVSLQSGSQTCLAKILGIYQVRQNKSGKEIKTDLMVMENLVFGRNISRTYDLKGAVFSRYVSDVNGHDKVLLDQNFIEDMCLSPIYVGGRTKHLLQRAIWNDTSFLTSINVMDYSLLVGVDKQRRELVFGIIDYLRQYTWDKQLETWVKASLVVPKNSLPTVISPKEYKKRFRKFMTKYFLTVPDTWCSETCSGPCRFCADGHNNLSIPESLKLPESVDLACA